MPVFYVGGIAAVVIVALVMAFVYSRSFHSRPTPAASPVVVAATAPSRAPAVLPAAVPCSVHTNPTDATEPAIAKPADAPADKVVPASKPVEPKPKISAPVRAQEFYNAALVKLREGKPQDAAALFRQAADLGDANAMQELGESYSNGEGVSQKQIWKHCAGFCARREGETPRAMLSLGVLYLFGSDAVPQSDDDAVHWFQKAADLKNPAGLYDLAGLYEKGQGVPETWKRPSNCIRNPRPSAMRRLNAVWLRYRRKNSGALSTQLGRSSHGERNR